MKKDRRIEKTERALFNALSSLLQRKRYSAITVQEILNEASVGRTTFYAHYMDKDDLLMSYAEAVFQSMKMNVNLHKNSAKSFENRLPIAKLFEHVHNNSRLFRGILVSESGGFLLDNYRDYWNNLIGKYLLQLVPDGKDSRVPLEILTNYMTSTIFELLRWWQKSEEVYTPKQMEIYFFAMVSPCVKSVLGFEPKVRIR